MKECLACWEEIEDTEVICPYCGSNQEEVLDYLALVVLKQGKRKIEVPTETPVLDYVFDMDPSTEEDISVNIKSPPSHEPQLLPSQVEKPGFKSDGTYIPARPSWLARPIETDDKTIKTESEKVEQEVKDDKPSRVITKSKTISCPSCSKDVPLLQYCKYCGQRLLRNCPKCNKEIVVTAKFCRGCGTQLDPFLDKD